MKTFIRRILIVAPVIALLFAFSQNMAAQSNALPALRGQDAVNQLKRNGDYDSLVSAVNAARQADGQFSDTPDAPDAVGQSAQLIAAGGLRDQFGSSVAVSGNTAIVGSPYNDPNGIADQGSAYIFINNGTTWTQQAKLNGTNAGPNDYFGTNVGISGDTVIVGARHNQVGQNAGQGSVYIFTRSNSIWTQQARIFAADGAGNDNFGNGVGIDGDTVVVGAPNAAVGANGFQGAVYIYTRSSGVWTQQAKLSSSDGAAFDAYGNSVAISGNTVVVGAWLAAVSTHSVQGAAYIYARTGSSWNQQAKLVSTDGAAGDRLGYSVGISGNTAIVGAFQSKVGGNNAQGSVYIFIGNNGVWAQQAKLIANDGAASDAFGFSVAIEGNTAVVGSLDNQVGTNYNQGSAYIYTRDLLNHWTQQSKLTAADGAANDDFGSSVAINGNNIVVGSYNDTVGGSYARGSACVFRTLSGNWTQDTKSVDPLGAANDNFGSSVAVSGDTAVVGAFQSTVASNAQGVAWVFIRNGASWTLLQAIYDPNGSAGDNFGSSIAISGETIIVGAGFNDVGANADQGAAYIFTRSGTSWSQQARLNGAGGAAQDNFGSSVAVVGDTAIVGAFRNTVGANTGQGSAYVFVRSGTIWTQQQQLNGAGGAANDHFGSSVGISGETVVVGAVNNTVGANTDQGSAYIFVRNGTTWNQQAQLVAANGAAGDEFGVSVGIDGDTVVVGASADDVGANADQGSAYIFERSGTTWTQKQQLIDGSGTAMDKFGSGVAVSGDKVIVGVPNSDVSTPTPINDHAKTFAPAAADQGAAIFFTNTPLAPTAAGVLISGRVMSGKSTVTGGIVSLTDASGIVRTARTDIFGRFRFEGVWAGETVIVQVTAKSHTFAPQVVTLTGDLTELDFNAL